jgi:hypothetical protein
VPSKAAAGTDFAELPDGTLLDTIEDPNNPARISATVVDRGWPFAGPSAYA